MSTKDESKKEQPAASRRNFLKYAAGVVVAGAAAAGGYYYGLGQSQPPVPSTQPSSTEVMTTTLTQALSSGVNWKKYSGQEIVVIEQAHADSTALNALLDEFTQLTGITVKPLVIPWPEHHTKEQLALSSGSAEFDVGMAWNVMANSFLANGWVEGLGKYISDTELTDPTYFDLNNFFQTPLKEGYGFPPKDELFFLPFYWEVLILMYNQDMLKAAGQKVPTTYDELLSVAKAVNSPAHAGIANRSDYTFGASYIWLQFLNAYGGRLFDENLVPTFNSPEGVASLEMYAALMQEAGPVQKKVGPFEIVALMQQEKLAMTIDCTVLPGMLEDPKASKVYGHIGYAVCPAGPAGQITGYSPNTLFINKFSKNKEAAWLFMEWALSKDVQLKTSLAGPRTDATLISVFENPLYKSMMAGWDGFSDTALNALKNTASTWWQPGLKNYGTDWFLTLGQAVENTVLGQSKAKDALDAAYKVIYKSQVDNGYIKQ